MTQRDAGWAMSAGASDGLVPATNQPGAAVIRRAGRRRRRAFLAAACSVVVVAILAVLVPWALRSPSPTQPSAATLGLTAVTAPIHGTWTLLTPANSPPADYDAMEAFDQATGQLILFGGGPAYGAAYDATWSWTGSSWKRLWPVTHPPGLRGAVMAYDDQSHQLLLFGGMGNSGHGVWYNTTWLWTGTTWQEAHPAVSPAARSYGCMAYDGTSHELVLFGGGGSMVYLQDTWAWNGSDWKQLHPSTSPPASSGQTMAWDPHDGGLIMLGGFGSTSDGPSTLGTWLWTGSTWTSLSPTTSPSPRGQASLALDPSIGVLVLFGGNTSSGHEYGDTWIWQGKNWELLTLSPSPGARSARNAFAYDPLQHGFILFGGSRVDQALRDTWVLDLTAT